MQQRVLWVVGEKKKKKREMFHPVSTKLTGTNAFGDLFKEIVC